MSANSTELERFRQFIERKLGNGGRDISVLKAINEFTAYEVEVTRLCAELEESIAEAQRGQAGPLDVPALVQDIRDDLAHYC